MYRKSFVDENFVCYIWNSSQLLKDLLRTKDGRKIEILNRGQRNDDSGADFHNAEIRIDGKTHKGDIEVHVKTSHWKIHHHNKDSRYNSTVLHVTLWDDGGSLLAEKQNSERIPTLILSDYLNSSITEIRKLIETGIQPKMQCAKAQAMTPEDIGKILDKTGTDRFIYKSKTFEKRLDEASADQALYEGIMDALGYSKNRDQFLALARIVPIEILLGQSPEIIQAILFGTAGLLPSQRGNAGKFDLETTVYIDKIENLWKCLSSKVDGRKMSYQQWNFFRIRPDNFPTKRIGGISYILSSSYRKDTTNGTSFLSKFIDVFKEKGRIPRKLRDILMPEMDVYWSKYYDFGVRSNKQSRFPIGKSRIDDIVINVILPAVYAYTRRLHDQKIQKLVIRTYAEYKRLQENRITRYVASQLFKSKEEYLSVVKSAMRQQGLIAIYKSHCSMRSCQNCPIIEESK